MPPRKLQRWINTDALSRRRQCSIWLPHLKDYVTEDKFIEELSGSKVVDRVLLKTHSSLKDENYVIRAGQLLGVHKFQSERLREAYCYVKALKKVLGVDGVSMFMVKKLLMGRKVEIQ